VEVIEFVFFLSMVMELGFVYLLDELDLNLNPFFEFELSK
jgi:hypothetical protein